MAAPIQKLRDNYLSCIICTDLYKDPCTLSCGHTFCRVCLIAFTKTQEDAIKAKSILCPNCRQMTKVTNPRGTIEDWVKQIKPSFFIQGLVDDFFSKYDDDKDPENLCFSCQQTEKKTSASFHCTDCDVFLCNGCEKIHKAMPTSTHHQVAVLGGEVKMRRKSKTNCKIHSCIVELCCRNCKQAICQKCCVLNHRKCSSVVPLVSMVSEMKAALAKTKEILKTKQEKTYHAFMRKRNMVGEIQARKLSIESEITQVAQNVIKIIKQKESALIDELKAITDKQIEELKGQMKSYDVDMQMYQQHCEFIDKALIDKNEVDMFEIYQICQLESPKTTTESGKMTQDTLMKEIVFIQQFEEYEIDNNFQLGIITLKGEFDPKAHPAAVDTVDVTLKNEILAYPVDVTVMDVNGTETMVVTDYNNSCVKSIYTKWNKSYNSSIRVRSKPWCLTRLDKTRIAASLLDKTEIVLLDVTPALVLLSYISTQKIYEGLTTLDDSSVVALSLIPPSLDILDLTGHVRRKIRVKGGQIRYPSFLSATTAGTILVSDCRSRSVYCLTTNGDVVFEYSPSGDRALEFSRGITSSKKGDIFVVDSKKNKVIQLTASGEFVRDILTIQDGICKPYGICLYNDKLYVTQEEGPVKVFRLSKY